MKNKKTKKSTIKNASKISNTVNSVSRLVQHINELNYLIDNTIKVKDNIVVDMKTYSITSLDCPTYL